MSVSLCALRLELGGDSAIPKNFTYLGIVQLSFLGEDMC